MSVGYESRLYRPSMSQMGHSRRLSDVVMSASPPQLRTYPLRRSEPTLWAKGRHCVPLGGRQLVYFVRKPRWDMLNYRHTKLPERFRYSVGSIRISKNRSRLGNCST